MRNRKQDHVQSAAAEDAAANGETEKQPDNQSEELKKAIQKKENVKKLHKWLIVFVLIFFSTILGLVLHVYGFAILQTPHDKMLQLSSAQVDEIVSSHKFLHVGGPHRGGTTMLWNLLRDHPDISGFADKVGSDLSEGIFMQTVYPRFGIGHELDAVTMAMGREKHRNARFGRERGLGKYGMNSDNHLQESYMQTPKAREVLLRQWGYFWDFSKPVLLEKSPSNIIISRFLQALWTGGELAPFCDGCKSFSPPQQVHFVFITRDPLANSMAHHTWQICKSYTIFELVLHWVALHERLESDLGHLKSYTYIKFEEFVNEPDVYLSQVYEAIGLDGSKGHDHVVTVKKDTNLKYRKQYCEDLHMRYGAMEAHDKMVKHLNEDVLKFGYDLTEWAECDGYTNW